MADLYSSSEIDNCFWGDNLAGSTSKVAKKPNPIFSIGTNSNCDCYSRGTCYFIHSLCP